MKTSGQLVKNMWARMNMVWRRKWSRRIGFLNSFFFRPFQNIIRHVNIFVLMHNEYVCRAGIIWYKIQRKHVRYVVSCRGAYKMLVYQNVVCYLHFARNHTVRRWWWCRYYNNSTIRIKHFHTEPIICSFRSAHIFQISAYWLTYFMRVVCRLSDDRCPNFLDFRTYISRTYTR